MTTRRKSRRQDGSSSPIDEKEHADRIAAAEAMSCLSSMVVLPSNSEELLANVNIKGKRGPKSSKASAKSGNANKKGKTRTRSTKNSPASPNKTSIATSEKESTLNSKQKHKSPKLAAALTNPLQKPNKLPDQVLSLTINPRNPNLESKKVEAKKTEISDSPKQPSNSAEQPTTNPAFIKINPLPVSNSHPAVSIQVDNGKPGQGLINLSSSDLQKLLAGKLPFQVKPGGIEAKNEVAPAQVSASNPVNTLKDNSNAERVENVMIVQKLLTQIALKQKLESSIKEQTIPSGSSLPLKKRRLQGYQEGENQVPEEPTTEVSKPEGAALATQERVNPVSVDPSTSLLLLNEIQVALQQDDDGDLPLHIAVVHENIVMVQKFVHLMSISGKSVDKYNKAQQTPLHIAVELKFMQAIQCLLLAGANPNLVNKNGENCVHMAVKSNSLDCLTIMYQNHSKLDVNARNFEGLAPIHIAVMKDNLNIVKFLLAVTKANIDIQDGKSGKTPLYYAVEANNLGMVEFFQSVGANLDLANYASVTAVMAAQAKGHHEIASMLLKSMDTKAYLDLKEKERGIPLKKAPLPRIPSKSHLIQGSMGKSMVDLQQLANSDSEDSAYSYKVFRKKKRSTGGKRAKRKASTQEVEIQEESSVSEDSDSPQNLTICLPNASPTANTAQLEQMVQNKQQIVQNISQQEAPVLSIVQSVQSPLPSVSQPIQNGLQAQNPAQQQGADNQESILVPRAMLEKLQNTMLSYIAMLKVHQSTASVSVPQSTPPINSVNRAVPLMGNNQISSSAGSVASSSMNMNFSNLNMQLKQSQNLNPVSAPSVTVSSKNNLHQPNQVTQNVVPMPEQLYKNTSASLASILQNPMSLNFLNALSQHRGAMAPQNPRVSSQEIPSKVVNNQGNPNLGGAPTVWSPQITTSGYQTKEVPVGKTTTSKKAEIPTFVKNTEKPEKKKKNNTLQNLLNKDGTKSNKKSKGVPKEVIRTDEPMETVETDSQRSNSPQFSNKNLKNQGIGHAAMNQLGQVTNVSSSLQATLLKMLQAKQSRPDKEMSDSSS